MSGIWVWATTTDCSWVTADCGIDPSLPFAPRAHLPSIANAVNVAANPSPSPRAGPPSAVAGRCVRVQATHAVTSASGSNPASTQRMVFSDGGRTAPSKGSTQAPNASSWSRVRLPARRLGVRLKVFETEWGVGAKNSVALDAPAEGVLVGMEDEVPDWNGMLSKAGGDLAPVLLDQDSHGHHQSAAGVVENTSGGLDDERPPWRPVLKVIRSGQPQCDVHKCLADLFGIEHP